jgi:hypothetical protein
MGVAVRRLVVGLALSDQPALRRRRLPGALRGMSIASRNGSGRVAKLRLDGLSPAEISGQDLRSAVGATSAGSTSAARSQMRRIGNAYH